MKKLILLTLISGLFGMARAQEFSRGGFSIGPELGVPSQSVYGIGYGASAKLEIPVINKFALSLTGGYSEFHFKSGIVNSFGGQAPSTFVPLKAGVVYGAGAGLSLEFEMGDAIETSSGFTGSNRNLLAYSFGPAFLVRISDKQAVDIGVRYERWAKNTLTQTGIRVAYRLGW